MIFVHTAIDCNLCTCKIFSFILLQIILTVAEHHSSIVPWQLIAKKVGAVLKFVDLNQDGIPDIDKLKELFSRKTKIVVVHHVSNVLGMFLTMMVHVDNSNLINDALNLCC